ncbi:hypothetical protein [Mycoplasma putrefaciens]|uniref:Lipoprotein n=1 Tax=Mycoplasma putrefaciens (strain ATCC 15718 / NCTC 10155 / C30 KS-1 / KS-1) TaxID=743965 RepID=A0A7U3ZS10_MYCPK|nr:hypothetical protein [Mycoplasma putrefaciens]AEM68456.1 lipoprotein [Mycoplasma putrefaciens KS1]
MKKLLTAIMSVSLTTIPSLSVISCGTVTRDVELKFDSNKVTINRMKWNGSKFNSSKIEASDKNWHKYVLDSTPGYGDLINKILTLLNFNTTSGTDSKTAYSIFKGKTNKTTVTGQWMGSKDEYASLADFYNEMDNSQTHISSIKGLLQLKEFVEKPENKEVSKKWTRSLKTDLEKVEKWDNDGLTNGLKDIINSTHDIYYKSVALDSDIKQTNSKFLTFDQNINTSPTTQGQKIDLKESDKDVLGELLKNNNNDEYIFGTNPLRDPYGVNVIGNNGADVKAFKPTITYSSNDIKQENMNFNVSEKTMLDDIFKFNINLNENKTLKWSSKYNFYYMDTKKQSDTLKLKLVYGSGNNEFKFNVELGGLYKVFIPSFVEYTPKDNANNNIKHIAFGWKFAGYRFSDNNNINDLNGSFSNIDLTITKA